ncbi:MAG: 4Fe-4S binding protein [Armatimonadota bacterium]
MVELENYNELRKLNKSLGLKLFGVCRIEDFIDHTDDFLKKFIGSYKYAVCVGYNLSPSVLETIIDKPNKIYFRHYKMVNMLLDQASLKIGNYIEDAGYKAMPIPASLILDWEMQTAHMNHKVAAHLAGLGWIGKNNLLVNENYGSAARYVTVLTDMPLTVDKPSENGCGSCSRCVEVCPVGALDNGYDLEKCHSKLKEFAKKEHVGLVCGLCVKVCTGRKK